LSVAAAVNDLVDGRAERGPVAGHGAADGDDDCGGGRDVVIAVGARLESCIEDDDDVNENGRNELGNFLDIDFGDKAAIREDGNDHIKLNGDRVESSMPVPLVVAANRFVLIVGLDLLDYAVQLGFDALELADEIINGLGS